MGYYTRFELDEKSIRLDDIDVNFDNISGYTFNTIFIDEESVKWYDCEEDMCQLSKLYPNHTFELKGVGEEFPDIWVSYFKNGKHVRYEATITYQQLEINDLK